MTTAYLVAYPHPSIPPQARIRLITLDSLSSGQTILDTSSELHPQLVGDLNPYAVEFYKANELSVSLVDSDSLQEVFERIHTNKLGHAFKGYEKLAKRFPEGPDGDLIDIVIITPEIKEAVEILGDLDGNLAHLKAREDLLKEIRAADSPSDAIKSPAAIKRAVDNYAGPRYGRPSERSGPPAVLYNKELALLKYDLDNLETFVPSSSTASDVCTLIDNATAFFDSEGGRERSLRSTLEKLIAGTVQWRKTIADRNTRPDGLWEEGIFYYLVFEVKDEPGLGGDPFLQGMIVYNKIVTQNEYTPFRELSNLPAILISLAGNRLTVSAAVFTDAVYVDELLSITLRAGIHAPSRVLHVARVFMAINKCAERLRTLYHRLPGITESPPPATVLWPNPTPDPPSSAGWGYKLEIFSKMDRLLGTRLQAPIDEANKSHAIYLARAQLPGETLEKEVLIKFAARYNETAHKLLADNDPPFAPTLYSCTPVIGDLFMVVMQYIPESEGRCLRDPSLRPNLSAVREQVAGALDVLHKNGLVFGDLREGNLLYLPCDGDGGRLLLIDFDGVGKHEEDRYSACLNPGAGLGVERMQIMEKSHDLANLERLMDRLSEQT